MNFGIIINIILLMLASVVLYIGIEFFVTSKVTSNQTRIYVLFYCIFSAVWCSCYGAIGITDKFDLATILRSIGVVAINGFNVTEVFLLAYMSGADRRVKKATRGFMILIAISDVFTFARFDIDIFIRNNNWTTWVGNPERELVRHHHSIMVLLTMIDMFILGTIWLKNSELKRQKRFIRYVFVANFIMALFTVPDTLLPLRGYSAISTSGIGSAICTIVIWYGAAKLNSFDINMGNIVSNIYRFIDAGVLVFDMDHKLAVINPYGQKMICGENRNDLYFSEIFEVDEEQETAFFQIGDTNIARDRLEAKLNGRIYSVKNSVVLDDYDELYCFICACVDVTDEINMVNELETANNAKNNFLTSISHEIRTPINAVLGFTEIITQETDNSKILTCTDNITRAGSLLLSIINDLLDMNKITSGEMEIENEEYELNDVLVDVYLLNSVKAEEKGLYLTLVNDEQIPKTLIGDSVRIKQIITNIVNNAIKYTSTGSVELKVSFTQNDTTTPSPGIKNGENIELNITVKDTGMGIKDEDIPFLFDNFARFDSKKNKHIEGTGVGLSITKSLVDKMDGKINVASIYGVGTRFDVVIPQTVADNTPIGKVSTTGLKHPGVSGKRAPYIAPDAHVLAVDDNPMNLMVFAGLVNRLQVKVDTASDGTEMLTKIGRRKYDLVFLDHMMPDLDGIETLNIMKADPTHPNQDTPVIVMTANCIHGAKEEYLSVGFDDFVGKPVQMSTLETVIKQYLPPELIKDAGGDIYEIDSTFDFPFVEGVNWEMAIRTSPDKEFLKTIIETFYNSANKDINELNNFYEGVFEGVEDSLNQYRIKVHSMKNSLALVGAAELSLQAKELEFAARDDDRQVVCTKHEKFIMNYRDIADRLELAMTGQISSDSDRQNLMTNDELVANLDILEKAMEDFDVNLLNDLSFKLEECSFESHEIKKTMDDLLSSILVLDKELFNASVNKLRSLM